MGCWAAHHLRATGLLTISGPLSCHIWTAGPLTISELLGSSPSLDCGAAHHLWTTGQLTISGSPGSSPSLDLLSSLSYERCCTSHFGQLCCRATDSVKTCAVLSVIYFFFVPIQVSFWGCFPLPMDIPLTFLVGAFATPRTNFLS